MQITFRNKNRKKLTGQECFFASIESSAAVAYFFFKLLSLNIHGKMLF